MLNDQYMNHRVRPRKRFYLWQMRWRGLKATILREYHRTPRLDGWPQGFTHFFLAESPWEKTKSWTWPKDGKEKAHSISDNSHFYLFGDYYIYIYIYILEHQHALLERRVSAIALRVHMYPLSRHVWNASLGSCWSHGFIVGWVSLFDI